MLYNELISFSTKLDFKFQFASRRMQEKCIRTFEIAKRTIKTIDYLFLKRRIQSNAIEPPSRSLPSALSLEKSVLTPLRRTIEKKPCHTENVKISSKVSPRSIVAKFQEEEKKKSLRKVFTLLFLAQSTCVSDPPSGGERYKKQKEKKRKHSLVSRSSGSHAVFFSRRKKQVNTLAVYFEQYPNLLVC